MGREHTDTWFFFGDSITLGVGDNEVLGGFVSRLALLSAGAGCCQLPPATFYNMGVRRHTVARVFQRFEREYEDRLIPGTRSRLFFCAGTVDLMGGADPEAVVRELAEMLARAKEIAPALFVCPPPSADEKMNAAIRAYGLAAEEACRALNVPCVNLFDSLLEAGFLSLLADKVHPGPQGCRLMAELLFNHPMVRSLLTVSD